ncbi:hypothetical protein FQN50_007904 [Emmonsiellopsis sp. PD_5]|nr:hypothetical protein FQN50_007904 [Emmonsiellopsis sp. PD_5]
MAGPVVYPYIISRFADPLFAIFIGTSSAFVRIRREQREKYPDQPADALHLFNIGKRRVNAWWNGWGGKL